MNELTLKLKYNTDNPSRILEMIKNYNYLNISILKSLNDYKLLLLFYLMNLIFPFL